MTSGRPVRGAHLDLRLSALADGELGHDERDHALAHAAECSHCLAALDEERRLKARLGGLRDPGLPAGLTDRLLALAESSPAPDQPPRVLARARAGWLVGWPGMDAPGGGGPLRPSSRGDARRPPGAGGRSPRRSLRRVSATAGGLVMVAGATLGAVLVVGSGFDGGAGSPVAILPVPPGTGSLAASDQGALRTAPVGVPPGRPGAGLSGGLSGGLSLSSPGSLGLTGLGRSGLTASMPWISGATRAPSVLPPAAVPQRLGLAGLR